MNHWLVSYVYSIGTLGVGGGVYHMYKTKGPYNLMVTRARCSIVRTFGRLLSGNFHTYSIPHVGVLFCIVLY